MKKRKLEKSKECGPWKVKLWEVPSGMWSSKDDYVVVSDDFTHDVHLEILGDFASMAEKKRYAMMIARRLNKATKAEKGRI